MNHFENEECNTDVNHKKGDCNLGIDEISDEEICEVYRIFLRLIKKYEENSSRETTEWLAEQLAEELPDKDKKEIRKVAEGIVETIREYDKNLNDLNRDCQNGIPKEVWLKEKILDGAKGVAVNHLGDYLNKIERNFTTANAQMARTILRADGEVNQNINLDGFIAEQYHVNNFNAKAVLEDSPFRARVCIPEDGRYTENSVDVMIDNIKTGKKGIARYQFKFGKDIKSTIAMLKGGNYDNQRIVVPKGQVKDIQKYMPNKSVTDHIGNVGDIKTVSDAITKEQVKELQIKVQEEERFPKVDWNSYQPQEMARNIAKQAGQAGIQAAFIGMGINIPGKALNGERIETHEVVETALKTGSDTFVKASAGGALKVAVEKELIPFIPKETPTGTIVKIACVGVENIKILWKVAEGDLTISEALENMGRTSVSMYAGLSAGGVGAGIGAVTLSFMPLIGPLVGGLVGGIVGYSAGSRFGEAIFEEAKQLVKRAVEIVRKVPGTVKDIASRVSRGLARLNPFSV